MQFILIFILTLLIALLILVSYLQYEKRKQNQNSKNNQLQINNRIMDKNPLDNATYIECHDIQEANREDMLNEILHHWKITNFWLGCIGIVFLFILVSIVASIIFSIQVGKEINDVFKTISF